MVLNYVWIGFLIIAFVVALVKTFGYLIQEHLGWFQGVFDEKDLNVFNDIMQKIFSSANDGFEISIFLTGALALWMGVMKIGENGGAVALLSRFVAPVFSKLFPEIPKNHPATGSIMMNFSANMLGLDNAATPFGLKAMEQLQSLNPVKNVASNAQIMFLVLNTSGLTLVPISVMALRQANGAANPADVFVPILLATYFATIGGLLLMAYLQKISLWNRPMMLFLFGSATLVGGIIYLFGKLSEDQVGIVSSIFANILLFGLIILFIVLALRKKINVYESFIEGAKGGLFVAIKIIPYLVGILIAVGAFRASGAMDYLVNGIGWLVGLFTERTEFVEALPTGLMKPLSGGGARGLAVDAMKSYGVDSFVARLASTFQGSTETTFYVLAVYFGSVNIKNTRYALGAGLFADLIGIIAAILIAYRFFSIA